MKNICSCRKSVAAVMLCMALLIGVSSDAGAANRKDTVEQWGRYELSFKLKVKGNPFEYVDLRTVFINDGDTVTVKGFYDGDDTYRVRFMPGRPGEWSWHTKSDRSKLDGRSGRFVCVAARERNHGPVVTDSLGFRYADGTRYIPVGTTCYAWVHQPEELRLRTLRTLSEGCFNKIRMCVFPKSYDWNHNEPELYPYEGKTGEWDSTRFNPAYFRNIEECVAALDSLGIEADIIVYHPYDRWGFSRINKGARERYMQYLISRLGAYKNVWWSMANEYDFMEAYNEDDWRYHLEFFASEDPFGHLRSIHNAVRMYDHSDSNVTHVSIQSPDTRNAGALAARYQKPVIYDECRYEGNIPWVWGTLSAEEMVQKFWEGFLSGGFVGHGEVLLSDPAIAPGESDEVLWWSKGGVLRGGSPERIGFLRGILEEAPHGIRPVKGLTGWQEYPSLGVDNEWYLIYFGRDVRCQMYLELPQDNEYGIEMIDTWNMTVSALEGTYRGHTFVQMPERQYMAIRIKRR